jgi:hypothetical protein
MIELLFPCGFDTLEYSWVKSTIGICTIVDYSVAQKCQHLGRIIEHHRDHVRFLYDLPNGTSLTQKIVVSLVFLIIEIFAIENHKLYDTFLHVVFKSQSLLRITSDLTSSDTN